LFICIDASNYHLGADTTKKMPVASSLINFNADQKRYTTTERDLQFTIEALENVKHGPSSSRNNLHRQ
jgi:hypothetical protein